MKYVEASVLINAQNRDLAEELVVSIFDDLGLSGVVVEDPYTVYEALPPDVIVDPDMLPHMDLKPRPHAVIGYFPLDSTEIKKCRALESALVQLKRSQNITTTVTYREIDEEDWAESWKVFFRPEKIGDHVVVKPTWYDYDAKPEEIIVELDPGMAFGTGTHPTTAMSIRMLETKLQPGQRILDIGTGSGILLISAAKLGACCGIGIDNDTVATVAASANLALNHIDPKQFSVIKGNLVESVTTCFDLITANILAEVILELIANISHVLKPEGLFICSGIIEPKADQVIEHLGSNGFQVIEKALQDDWVCIAARSTIRHPATNSDV